MYENMNVYIINNLFKFSKTNKHNSMMKTYKIFQIKVKNWLYFVRYLKHYDTWKYFFLTCSWLLGKLSSNLSLSY